MSEKPAITNKSLEKYGFYVRLAGILFIITAVTALLLGFVNSITADRIEQLKNEATAEAMQTVMPDAAEFISLSYTADGVKDVFEAKDSAGNAAGYCVQTTPKGFGGDIDLVVGIDADGNVTGVNIVSHTETAGLGTKAEAPEYLGQYVGKNTEISMNTGELNSVNAISGATVTSRAVTVGVNYALDAVKAVKGGTNK